MSSQQRSHYIWVCTKRRPDGNKKGSCAAQGGEELARAMKSAATREGLDARVCTSGCFDLCWVGAAACVMPEMTFLKNLTLDDVPTVVGALKSGATLRDVESLRSKLVVASDFVDPALEKEEAS